MSKSYPIPQRLTTKAETKRRYSRSRVLSFTSVHRAKGLDALAVILIDFRPFEEIKQPGYQAAYFMGASRARQMLAVVHLAEDGMQE